MNDISLTLKKDELNILLDKFSNIINQFLLNRINPSVLLSGELGAGKTTFVREWLKFVGSNDLANSPTFALHNIYEWNHIPIHHFDLYRLKNISELSQTGFEEIWGQDGISFIEWWEVADSMIPIHNRIFINIHHLSLDQRLYEIKYELK